MTKYLLLIDVLMSALLIHARQEVSPDVVGPAFNAHWVSTPMPDSLTQVWFRQTYLSQGRAVNAHLVVASTGFYKVYVNQCNVGTALFYPTQQPDNGQAVAHEFDITTYLRPDTNVIAVWYAPSGPRCVDHQVSVIIYGTTVEGKPFSHVSDGNWLCRQANAAWLPDGHETIDGQGHDASWNAAAFNAALWVNAKETESNNGTSVKPSTTTHAPHITHIKRYKYFDAEGDTVDYEFGTGFRGMVRITLREAHPGERIFVDGNEYICNGQMDEQYCPVFRVEDCRRVRVYGDEHFSQEQITDIEALTISQPDDPLPRLWMRN